MMSSVPILEAHFSVTRRLGMALYQELLLRKLIKDRAVSKPPYSLKEAQ
jgi:hypothetical protein